MKTSTVLKKAKKQLSKDYKMGICRAVGNTDAKWKDVDRIQLMIGDRLGGWAYAHNWLGHQVLYPNVDFGKLNNRQFRHIHDWSLSESEKDIQAWRHAWLDRMIAEFEAKGD